MMDMQVINVYGDPAVAEVGVVRFRDDERFTVEVVDGLTPPMPRDKKWIINLSTQFGCPVGCPFCDAALAYHALERWPCWRVFLEPGSSGLPCAMLSSASADSRHFSCHCFFFSGSFSAIASRR